MIDEMGMGAFTWTVENPNGIYYKDIGYGMVEFNANSPFLAPTLVQRSGRISRRIYTGVLQQTISSGRWH